jgi:hypothetical protein
MTNFATHYPPDLAEFYACAYRLGPAVVGFATDNADVSRWLAEFLTPWFTRDDGAHPDYTVRLNLQAARFDALDERLARGPCENMPCFGLDSQLVHLPGWRDDDATILADTNFGCFYCARGTTVEVIARPGSLRFRVGIMRVVRELAATCTSAMLDLHGAAFVVAGKAILLVGEKRAGKTTLLVHALSSGQASLLANDRLLVDTASVPAQALGVPTVVVVREPTLRLFPRLLKGGARRTASLHSGELDLADAADSKEGLVVSPAQLADRLGAGVVAHASVAAIIFPEISPTVATWSLEPLKPAEGSTLLAASLYGSRYDAHIPSVLHAPSDHSHSRDAQLVLTNQLATTVPLLRCRLGPDAYRDSSHAWLAALQGAAQ